MSWCPVGVSLRNSPGHTKLLCFFLAVSLSAQQSKKPSTTSKRTTAKRPVPKREETDEEEVEDEEKEEKVKMPKKRRKRVQDEDEEEATRPKRVGCFAFKAEI